MTAKHGAAAHHASAAMHHGHAAQFHREASRHYQVGKDYAHAAHQALVAFGHTAQAMEYGQQASLHYAQHGGNPLPLYLDRSAGADAGSAVSNLTGAEHHTAAADEDEKAGWHHTQAAKQFDAQEYALAAKEARLAHWHAQHSISHGNEAARSHVEHTGPAGPPADIV